MKSSIRKTLVTLLASLSCLLVATACESNEAAQKEIKATLEQNTYVDFTEYFQKGDTLINANLRGVDGKEIPLGNGSVYLEKQGAYKLTLVSGVTYVFDVQDLQGPIAVLENQAKTVYMGDVVKIDPIFKDFGGDEVAEWSYTVTKDGKNIEVNEHDEFVARETGEYIVGIVAKDENGHTKTTELTILSMESAYGRGVYAFATGYNGINVSSEPYSEGNNEGKYRTVMRKSADFDGFGTLTITATEEAELKPDTLYELVFRVDTDCDEWCYYTPTNEWLIKESVPYVRLYIRTDDQGAYTQTWETFYRKDTTCFDITEVSFREYVYGEGIELALSSHIPTNVQVEDEKLSEGENTGKYIKTLTRKDSENVSLNLTVREDAGLKPNTGYTVLFIIDTDGDKYPSYYEAYNAWWCNNKVNTFLYDITTDSNGCASIYALTHFGSGSYVRFTNIKIIEMKYGTGISLLPTVNSPEEIEKTLEELTEGEDKGKYIQKLTRLKSGFGALTISANSDAGLKSNTEYLVTVYAETDGEFPAYYQPLNQWFIDTERNTFSFKVWTDENGVFTQNWQTYFNKGTFVRFTDITFEEIPPYAYGKGVAVEVAHNGYMVVDEKVFEGENAGKYVKTLTNVGNTAGTFGSLRIAVMGNMGLKANTSYTVTVTVDITTSDGSTGWAYYQAQNQFLLSTVSSSFSFTVTTDTNGAFTKEYGQVYATANTVKVVFEAIVITENSI